eukprot:TRINITY_DN24976_c0_g1_i1.p1 TRINITY_DN24976_c0_g1~~TRINITY_DN24976_c0_g1_i1.p1  ORF type:complete len:151 (+),score=40.29 TRINITY_DN24976_c0_g1_i1:130-582(+)
MSEQVLTPYLYSSNCQSHMEWLRDALGATIKETHSDESGKVMHAELGLIGATIYMSDEMMPPEYAEKPWPEGGTRGANMAMVLLTMPDVDAFWARAMEHGGTSLIKLADQCWGARFGIFRDPFGFQWGIITPMPPPEAKEPKEPKEPKAE